MNLLIVISCLLLSFLFSGLITAYTHSNKVLLNLESKKETPKAKILSKLLENSSLLLTALRTGNIIAVSIFSFYISKTIFYYLSNQYPDLATFWILLAIVCIATLILIITSKLVSKLIFKIASDHLILKLAYPTYVLFLILKPIGQLFLAISDWILETFFKLDKDNEKHLFSLNQLEDYISDKLNNLQEGEELDTEVQIFKNALEFPEVKAREIMVPRTEVSALEVTSSIDDLKTIFKETGYSKIIIYQETIDNIIGYVHLFQLLKKPTEIRDIINPIIVAPSSIYIKDLFKLLSSKGKSIAVIIDEYGGTSGIITLEDIIEELFGEIDDEHDISDDLLEKQIDENTYVFSARIDVDDLNEKYNFDIPKSESYTTLGGYIVDNSKDIPQRGQQIELENFNIKILKGDSKKIELVKFSIKNQEKD